MSALEFRAAAKPGKTTSGEICSYEGHGEGGASGRYYLSICGLPVLNRRGRRVVFCTRCRREFIEMWAGFGGREPGLRDEERQREILTMRAEGVPYGLIDRTLKLRRGTAAKVGEKAGREEAVAA